jgi:hypothetical protein
VCLLTPPTSTCPPHTSTCPPAPTCDFQPRVLQSTRHSPREITRLLDQRVARLLPRLLQLLPLLQLLQLPLEITRLLGQRVARLRPRLLQLLPLLQLLQLLQLPQLRHLPPPPPPPPPPRRAPNGSPAILRRVRVIYYSKLLDYLPSLSQASSKASASSTRARTYENEGEKKI